MPYIIRIIGAANGGKIEYTGQYVKSFNADGRGGIGSLVTTTDKDKAKQFRSSADAFNFYRMQSHAQPMRPDGKPNRPLTAFHVEIEYKESPP